MYNFSILGISGNFHLWVRPLLFIMFAGTEYSFRDSGRSTWHALTSIIQCYCVFMYGNYNYNNHHKFWLIGACETMHVCTYRSSSMRHSNNHNICHLGGAHHPTVTECHDHLHLLKIPCMVVRLNFSWGICIEKIRSCIHHVKNSRYNFL